MRHLKHVGRGGLLGSIDLGLRGLDMRTERWCFVLCTRVRDEWRRDSVHRLNPRCIGYCDLTGSGFVPALVTPAAMVDKPACVSCFASALSPDFGIGSDLPYFHFLKPCKAHQGMITMIVALERDIGTLSLATVTVETDDAL
jgi:hypothetical protein